MEGNGISIRSTSCLYVKGKLQIDSEMKKAPQFSREVFAIPKESAIFALELNM